jgi:predicted Ser/Thr protein kinase
MDPQTQTSILHPLVGQTLKQYHVEGVLGQGGMGIVYRGQDLKLQRPVALKLLATELTADEDRRKRFLREALAAARISHPAVAQVYDVDEHEGAAFLAMELVDGRTVRDLIRSGEMDLMGTLDITLQVCEGLAKAHSMGIIHRDIKPANVMVTRDGHAKILDFGLAKLIDPSDTSTSTAGVEWTALTQTRPGLVMGTAAYMSPEQVKGQPVDARSDLFSLGVMLFEMATGALPFQRDTPMQTMQAVAFDHAPPARSFKPSLPAELQRILDRCLQKNPQDRYADARALIADLRLLRRDTESGLVRVVSLRERLADLWDRLTHLSRSQLVWLTAAFVAAGVAFYLMYSDVGLGGFLLIGIIGLLFYRHVRNQPHRLLDRFTRKTAKIPEVRFIAVRDTQITVGVDRAIGQLYGRINTHLNDCNRKIFFGKPWTVAIRHELSPDETRQFLNDSGVQYVRDDPQATPPKDIP